MKVFNRPISVNAAKSMHSARKFTSDLTTIRQFVIIVITSCISYMFDIARGVRPVIFQLIWVEAVCGCCDRIVRGRQ